MFPAGNYDQVISVALEDGQPSLKLPYNQGDNTMQIAQRFLTLNQLSMAYADQIRNHIEKNIQKDVQPLIRPTNNSAPDNQQVQPQSQNPAEPPKKVETKKFPLRQNKYWTDINVEGMSKKIKETNEMLFDKQDARALNAGEWSHFSNLLNKIRDPLMYANNLTQFKESEYDAFRKVLQWDANDSVAIIDMFRVMLNHNSSQAFLGGADSGYGIMLLFISKLNNKAVTNVFYKVLCN